MSRYRVTPAAREDLKRISRFIAIDRQSPTGAKRLREQFLDCFRQLARSPMIGQAYPEYGANVRISVVRDDVVLYEPRDGGINIVQVAHGARDLPAIVRGSIR